MLTLGAPTRQLLRSFWIVLSVGLGVVTGVASWAFGAGTPLVWATVVGVVTGALGARWPALALRPYWAWDRLSRLARRGARLWLTAVAFLIITAVGRSGTCLAWSAPEAGASGWTPKRSPQPGSHRSTSDLSTAPATDGGWVRSLASWAGRSGNVWAWSLIPVLALLKVVEGKPTRSLGGNVYTLY
jgi:hypothetical protein